MIEENVQKLLSELPQGVIMLAAAKERNAHEISRAIEAGVTVVGENYLQDALGVFLCSYTGQGVLSRHREVPGDSIQDEDYEQYR